MKRPKAMVARPFIEGLAAFLIVFVAGELLRLSPRMVIALSALAAIGVIYRQPLAAWWRSAMTKPAVPTALAAVLAQSAAEIARLRAVDSQIEDQTIAPIVAGLAEAGEAIVTQAQDGGLEPRLGARVLSYYLPRAADLAEAWPALEGDSARRQTIQDLLERLLQVMQTTARGQSKEALRALDVDMRLLDQALDDDRADDRADRI